MLEKSASVATLILFVFYFIGRVITAFSVRRLWEDKVILGPCENAGYDIVEEICGDIACDETYGMLVSRKGMRNIKVFSVDNNGDGVSIRRGKLVFERDFLNVDQAVAIHVMPGDLFPSLYIEYITFDYMKVELESRDNLQSGVYSEFVQPKHTVKSFLYYLLR